MGIIQVKREQKENIHILTFYFHSINQLLDDSDIRALPTKEITEYAEETIWTYVDEFGITKNVELIMELPEKDFTAEIKTHLIDTIRHHFSMKLPSIRHEMILIKREGYYSSIITIFMLLIAFIYLYCVNIGILSYEKLPGAIIGFILVIANWASMWRTYEFYFYDFRNLNRKKNIYKKISKIPISIVEKSDG